MIAGPRVGVIGLAGAWSTELLADALEARTGFRLVIDPEKLAFSSRTRRLTAGPHDLSALDALVLRKMGPEYSQRMVHRLQLLQALAAQGVLVLSDPARIVAVIDRLSCTMRLQLAGIPMPPTTITEDPEVAIDAVREYGTAVLKPLFSTKARGMRVVRRGGDAEEALDLMRQAGNTVYYVQKLVDLPGHDLGLVFLGGTYLGAYARVAGPDSWNTTVHSGGTYRPHEPSPEVLDIAQRAQAVFGLDYTTVDVVETADGPLVFEVSAFGGFRGLYEASRVDAASLLADHVLQRYLAAAPSDDGRLLRR
jgi:ribosomal protein S6--L-glutamate ligase